MRIKPATVVLLFACVGCGLTESEYVAYQNPEPVNNNPSSCEAGVASFEANLASMISRCVTCHGANGNAAKSKLEMSASDHAANRTAFLNSSKYPDATEFYNYISSASHQGSSFVQAEDEASLKAWEEAEANCS